MSIPSQPPAKLPVNPQQTPQKQAFPQNLGRPATAFADLLLGPARLAAKLGEIPKETRAETPQPKKSDESEHDGALQGRHKGTSLDELGDAKPHERADDPLDPMNRRAFELGPPVVAAPPSPIVAAEGGSEIVETRARASLEELLPALVKKVAWSGNGTKGSVRLEVGRGSLAGGVILVHADEGRVRVEVTAPAGANTAEWSKRIDARLRDRGLDVEDVEVH